MPKLELRRETIKLTSRENPKLSPSTSSLAPSKERESERERSSSKRVCVRASCVYYVYACVSLRRVRQLRRRQRVSVVPARAPRDTHGLLAFFNPFSKTDQVCRITDAPLRAELRTFRAAQPPPRGGRAYRASQITCVTGRASRYSTASTYIHAPVSLTRSSGIMSGLRSAFERYFARLAILSQSREENGRAIFIPPRAEKKDLACDS